MSSHQLPLARACVDAHCPESLSKSGGHSRTGQSEEAGNGKIPRSTKGVEDPRTSSATRYDFVEIPAISLLSSLCGGQTCVDMADFAADNEAFLRTFMRLLHGSPSRDSFSRVFRRIGAKPFGRALARFAKIGRRR